ncbi:MAG: hypothetical protein OXH60_12425 [Rhodospirillales bacterium]|nr:hypothetical protein [Rhodospirillales bacterium]
MLAAFGASSAPTRVAGAAAPLLSAFEAAVLRAVLAGDVDLGAAFVFAATFVFGAAFALAGALALGGALAFLAVSVAALLGLADVDGAAAALAFDLDGVAALAAPAPFDRDAVFAVAFGAVLALFVVAAVDLRSVRSAGVFAERWVVDVDLEAVGGLRRALADFDLDEDVFDAVAVMGLGFRMADQTGRRNGGRSYGPGRLAQTLGSGPALTG